MKKNKLRSDGIGKIVEVSCVECGGILKFCIKNEVVVEGDGVIAINFPGAVCQECIESVLERVNDPPALVCIKNLSPILARELLLSFAFLLPSSEAVKFFSTLFQEI
jgi:hypothetical protein